MVGRARGGRPRCADAVNFEEVALRFLAEFPVAVAILLVWKWSRDERKTNRAADDKRAEDERTDRKTERDAFLKMLAQLGAAHDTALVTAAQDTAIAMQHTAETFAEDRRSEAQRSDAAGQSIHRRLDDLIRAQATKCGACGVTVPWKCSECSADLAA